MSGPFPWYVARSAGIVSWALLAGATLWGLALSTKVLGRNPKPNWILDLHRWLGGLSVVFVAVHIGFLLADRFVPFGVADVLIPMATTWHPGWVAWGIVSLYLLIAVEVTSLLRSRIPRRVWRSTHYLSFPLFVSATAHGLTSGTDARRWFVVVVAIAVSSLVAGLTAARVFEEKGDVSERVARGRLTP